jgi:hypothetical protein
MTDHLVGDCRVQKCLILPNQSKFCSFSGVTLIKLEHSTLDLLLSVPKLVVHFVVQNFGEQVHIDVCSLVRLYRRLYDFSLVCGDLFISTVFPGQVS